MIVARQFIAWNLFQKGIRPGGDGMIGSDRRSRIGTNNQPGIRSDRALRDGFSIGRVPGNKLPGYDHSVPPGRAQRSPYANAALTAVRRPLIGR